MHASARTTLRTAALLCAATTILAPGAAQADRLGHYDPSGPRIDIFAHGRDLHATDGSRIRVFRLAPREHLLWTGVANRLAVAVTDDRVVAITTLWKDWQTETFRIHESEPRSVVVGNDFVIVVTDDRVTAISDHAGSFVETRLRAYERVIDSIAGQKVGVVLTNQRAIGFSGRLANLVDVRVGIHEEVARAHASYDFATLATSKRLLVFDAPRGNWQTLRLALH